MTAGKQALITIAAIVTIPIWFPIAMLLLLLLNVSPSGDEQQAFVALCMLGLSYCVYADIIIPKVMAWFG